ncbi:hypothetical protein GGX14DRAFT_573992 [Mycena pura]|uniref:Uncharacterized protein n=1 Tax=Mycena pura TaxID=153505 RepID=A0AAD6Y7G3_9AGAR|nr:hypothetical protein GGX14DRAFT_573992 [Mycena pura]
MAGRRTLRSGKEFSAFDLAVCRAISPPVPFDAGERLMQRLLEGPFDDDEASAEPQPFWMAPLSPAPSLSATPPLPPAAAAPRALPAVPPPAKERSKIKSRARRDKKHEKLRAAAANPALKAVHRRRVSAAKTAALELEVDAAELKHSQSGWQGSATADKDAFEFCAQQAPHGLETGLGGVQYTQEEVDALTGTQGFMYIGWLGRLTIPLLDSQRRVIAILGGTPRDHAGWKTVTDGAALLLEERQSRLELTPEALHHRRARDAFPAIARGVAHGGGRLEPGEVRQNAMNTRLTDELLAHEFFQRVMAFASSLMLLWAPLLSAYYQANNALLRAWKPSMRWNCVNSVFAACTFNFGPRAITAPHLDFANLAWGWCSVTALGNFDPDFGGHLILWDLHLVVRFPPGSTLLIPSALIRHSNVPIRRHEKRSSVTQYTAGSLFRWVRNGCMTDDAFQNSASAEEKLARAAEDAQRWEEGVKMFSVVDDL